MTGQRLISSAAVKFKLIAMACVSDVAVNFLATMVTGRLAVGGPTLFAIHVSIPNVLQENSETYRLLCRKDKCAQDSDGESRRRLRLRYVLRVKQLM
jgi:hypothetical protein